jgi:hypothetical protein
MKKLALTAIAALTLTACATGNDAYYNAIAEREKRQAEQELRADTAIAQMAQSGDPQAKGMAIMYFATKNASKASQSAIAAPKSVAEQVLPWMSLLVPSLTQIYGIKAQTDVAITNSNNSVKNQQSSNEMIVDLVQGREQPIIGTEDDVLLFPN